MARDLRTTVISPLTLRSNNSMIRTEYRRDVVKVSLTSITFLFLVCCMESPKKTPSHNTATERHVVADVEKIKAKDPCQSTVECKQYGQCTTQSGKCVVKADEDCRRSQLCNGNAGFCSAVKGVCRPASKSDCRVSSECTFNGNCAFEEGQCVASSIQLCVDSALCGDIQQSSEHRICALDEAAQRCASCEALPECAKDGLCGLQLRRHVARCVTCSESDHCLNGYCNLKNGRCVNARGEPFGGTRPPARAIDARRITPLTVKALPGGPHEPVPVDPDAYYVDPNADTPPPGTAPTDPQNEVKDTSAESSKAVIHDTRDGEEHPEGTGSLPTVGLLKPTDRLKLRPSTRTQAQRFRAFRTWLKMRQMPRVQRSSPVLKVSPKGPNVQLHLVVL